MNIFFTGSIRGGRAQQPSYAKIIAALEEHGTVFSRHVSDGALSQYGETDLSAGEIHERELKALEQCDVVVAEVTTASLGVGYLIARATLEGKKVIALFHGEDTLKLSGIIKGDPLVEVHIYKVDTDIEGILQKALVI